MQIQILDSWLREHLDTKATATQIAEVLSLTSVSIERVEKVGTDFLYDIEVTTNRPDLMSVVSLAREASVALTSEGIPSKFIHKKISEPKTPTGKFPIKVVNNPKLVKRICAAVLSIKLDKSPQIIRDRLEASNIRSLNNVIDVTNYLMREIGHPAHVFDLDRLATKEMHIREAEKGEKIMTLDKKEHTLSGGEIVADDGTGKIIDLLGIMGTSNSVVTDETKNVLLFIDNNDKHKIRKASMELGIRSEAAVLNEKGIDPELSYEALLRGIQLLSEVADGKLTAPLLDIYPKKETATPITVLFSQIDQKIGVKIPEEKIITILEGLDFTVKKTKYEIIVTPPSNRLGDVEISEDVIEEIARMYGYHKLPSILPPVESVGLSNRSENPFYWEKTVKTTLKHWGFTEAYTYSLVSEDMLEVSEEDAVKIANPLGSDMAYLRTTLIPSLLQVVREGKNFENLKIFELANVYLKRKDNLPEEIAMLSGVIKKDNVQFSFVKGIIEGLFHELGIKRSQFKVSETATADIFVSGNKIGEIEVLDRNIIDFELNFTALLKYVTLRKTFTPLPKFPEAYEDLRLVVESSIEFETIASTIKDSSKLVTSVRLLDTYEDKKTFRVTFQSKEKNLTSQDISEAREKILHSLKQELNAEIA